MEEQPNIETGKPGQEIADVLSRLGEDHGFDHQTCQEIAEMEFPDAFEAAYGYLAQAGLDSDEVLAEFVEPEEP